MASFVGHGLAGLTVYTAAKRFYPALRPQDAKWFVALAILPDFDFMVEILFPTFHIMHRTWSHSLLFSIVGGVFFAALYQVLTRRTFRALWWLFPFTIFTHILIDMTCHETIGPGVPMFWPLTQRIYFPLEFMTTMGTYYRPGGNQFWYEFSHTVPHELLALGGIWVMTWVMLYQLFPRKSI